MTKNDVVKHNEVISEQQQFIYDAPKPEDEIDNAKYQSSTEAVPTTTPAPVIRTDIVLTEDFSLNLNIFAVAAAAEDDNNFNAKIHLECENSIVDLDGIQQDEGEALLPPESLDSNNFNYDDIDKETLQFKYEDLFGESEIIVFHDCDDNLDAYQQEEGNIELKWTLKKHHVDNTIYSGNKDYLSDTDVDPRFVNSTNGEIPEDELNCQTSEVDSKEMISAMKWKILVRQLGSDMNDAYHKETVDVWKTKVVVQVMMTNDRLKHLQHNQKNKEDQVYYDSNSDNDTLHGATQVEDVIEDTYDDNDNDNDNNNNNNNDNDNDNDDDNDNDNVNRKPINN